MRARRIRSLGGLAPLVALLCVPAAAAGRGDQAMRTVSYYGRTVMIPRSWPVYDLARDPNTCVRFNRPALYLGFPGTEQDCPADGVGPRQAILLEPPAPHNLAHARPGLSLAAGPGSGGAAPAAPPAFYTGLGFDACDVPSSQQMSAWTAHSSYRALGVYIGGINAACPPASDPNLTPSWLSAEAAAGWHFIPTYVGLQAPTNSCGCTAIKPSHAAAEGTAAADDAVNQAQSLDLPSGTPIYDDMEYYAPGQTNTSAVLAFLAAWTDELHARGYASGVYGNSDSAIADLASRYGTSYPEPDDIWFANWNGQKTTSDPDIPSGDWPNHQRLHQYRGGHNETHGGVTLNIDGDYLDGAIADDVVVGSPPPPRLSVSPTTSGLTNLTASWAGLGLARWEVLAGTNPTALVPVKSAAPDGAQTRIAIRSAAPYFALQALGASNQVLATSAPVPAPPHLALFGPDAFVGDRGGGGRLPVGCYLQRACHLVATLSVGRSILARTSAEKLPAGHAGDLVFRLNSTGRAALAAGASGRLPVTATIRDVGGTTAHAVIVLIGYTTKGRGPRRRLVPGSVIGPVGATDFVSPGGSAGILARCDAVYPCRIAATLSARGMVIATARPQAVGGLELGYVHFRLTSTGRQLLARARGNQLATSLALRCGTAAARGRIALALL